MDRRTFIAASAALLGSTAASAKPPRLPRLAPADFRVVLADIAGAEGLATAPDGRIAYSTSDAAVGLAHPDGRRELIGPAIATGGVAFDSAGRILTAAVGALHDKPGPLRRIDPASGTVETLVAELEGRALVTSNCPAAARDGTVYCSHTGWSVGNIGTTAAEGFIYAVLPDGRARIVARGLRGVNGLCLGPGERRLYAALTAEGRIMSWRRGPDGTLDDPRHYGPVLGTVVADQSAAAIRELPSAAQSRTGYCDGIAFDRAGNLFVTLPFANRVVAVTPRGRLVIVVDDPAGAVVDFPTNLAWGGPDGRDLLVVARGKGTIVAARMPVPGLPAANWPV